MRTDAGVSAADEDANRRDAEWVGADSVGARRVGARRVDDGWVDLVEVDGAPPRIQRRPAGGRRAGLPALLQIALVALVVAGGSVVAVVGAHHHRRLVVETVRPAPFAVDALACPVATTCGVRTIPSPVVAVFGRTAGTEIYDATTPSVVYARSMHASAIYQGEPASLTVVAGCGPGIRIRAGGAASSAEGPGSPTFTSSFVRRYRHGPGTLCAVDVWCVYVASFSDGYPNASPMMERLVASVAADPALAP